MVAYLAMAGKFHYFAISLFFYINFPITGLKPEYLFVLHPFSIYLELVWNFHTLNDQISSFFPTQNPQKPKNSADF
jgi:hypothetical protein